jgi:hypothetical protein
MRPTQHPSNNRVLGAPAGWDQTEAPCSAIALTDLVYAGARSVATFWELSDEERAAIAAGAKVMLIVPGSTMMPAALEVSP